MRTRKSVIFTVAFLFVNYCQAQVITTIAGNGGSSGAGDGGPATAAQLFSNTNICLSPMGNLYLASTTGYRIRMVNTAGIITNVAGIPGIGIPVHSGDGGPATDAQTPGAWGITTDGAGNIYFSEHYAPGQCIRKIDVAGIITTIAGVPGSFGYNGDGIPATAALLFNPKGIAIDAAGDIYFADYDNSRVRKISGGIITTVAGTGVVGGGANGVPATAAAVRPFDVVLDAAGNLYIANKDNSLTAPYHYISKVNTSGIITTVAGTGVAGYGGDGGPATAASIDVAGGLCIDGVGNIYFADGTHRIRKIDPSGIISTIMGNGTAGFSGDGCGVVPTQLNIPRDVIVDATGALYVADAYNYRVRKMSQGIFPTFTAGASQTLNTCKDSVANINSKLAITDGDVGQAINWGTLTAPAHGTLAATYTYTTTGSAITPIGLSYTPAAGYVGTDTFRVVVTDCGTAKDTTTVYVTVADCTLGIAQASFQKETFKVYPNPARDGSFTINVSSATNDEVRITVSNILGEKIKEFTTIANMSTDVQLANPPGVYFISATTMSGVWSKRVVITQ